VRAVSRAVVGALAADTAAVLLFAAAGRSSHAEGVTPSGVLATAWPFLAGGGVGWLVVRAWRHHWPVSPEARAGRVAVEGAVVALSAVIGGMLLRRATGAGTDPAFVVVATLVLGALLVGWRVGWRRGWSLLRRRSRPTWGRRSSARLGG